jgi:hypothetical protein
MDLNSRPAPHPQVAARVVDESAVIVLADRGEVNVLNPVGTRIWELCDGSRSVRQIAEIIASEFDVTAERALQDTEEFLGQLLQSNAVELKNAAG